MTMSSLTTSNKIKNVLFFPISWCACIICLCMSICRDALRVYCHAGDWSSPTDMVGMSLHFNTPGNWLTLFCLESLVVTGAVAAISLGLMVHYVCVCVLLITSVHQFFILSRETLLILFLLFYRLRSAVIL